MSSEVRECLMRSNPFVSFVPFVANSGFLHPIDNSHQLAPNRFDVRAIP